MKSVIDMTKPSGDHAVPALNTSERTTGVYDESERGIAGAKRETDVLHGGLGCLKVSASAEPALAQTIVMDESAQQEGTAQRRENTSYR